MSDLSRRSFFKMAAVAPLGATEALSQAQGAQRAGPVTLDPKDMTLNGAASFYRQAKELSDRAKAGADGISRNLADVLMDVNAAIVLFEFRAGIAQPIKLSQPVSVVVEKNALDLEESKKSFFGYDIEAFRRETAVTIGKGIAGRLRSFNRSVYDIKFDLESLLYIFNQGGFNIENEKNLEKALGQVGFTLRDYRFLQGVLEKDSAARSDYNDWQQRQAPGNPRP